MLKNSLHLTMMQEPCVLCCKVCIQGPCDPLGIRAQEEVGNLQSLGILLPSTQAGKHGTGGTEV